MTRDEIKDRVRDNLNDAGITFWSEDDLNDSFQDGYDDIAVISGCIQKSATVNFLDNTTYYNFRTLISDYYAPVAIYNNNNNRWMHPDNRRSFNKIRRDWEIWTGQPQFFTPIDARYVCIIPRFVTASGNMTVFYRATAPTISLGSESPLIHLDEHVLLEWYVTGDMLDQCQEFLKADFWWKKYFDDVTGYKERIGQLARTDYLPQLRLRDA